MYLESALPELVVALLKEAGENRGELRQVFAQPLAHLAADGRGRGDVGAQELDISCRGELGGQV